jgi:hypothetical protein
VSSTGTQLTVPARGLTGRIVGVSASPRAAYGDIAVHPRWSGALFLVVLMIAAASMAFFSTETGRQAGLDQQIRTAVSVP